MPKILLRKPSVSAAHSLEAYRREGGYRSWTLFRSESSPQNLIDRVEESGLTGKGGAGFPAHKKMRLMAAQTAPKKFLIVNGSEHEPGSLKDRFLLERNPHKVLEGALLSARAVGATDIFFAINETSGASLRSFELALREAEGALDFGGITAAIRTVPDIYIVGEESALLEVLEGKKPLPRRRPPFPIERGLHGFPTLIHNVETVAHLPFIAGAGAAAYRALGAGGKGVTLCTLGGEFVRPGIYEVPLGASIGDVLYDWGGGLRGGLAIKAIQPGGPSSGLLGADELDLPLDADILRARGSALGCAVIRAYSMNDCMVREISGVLSFFAHSCCGQCPRCRMETNMLDTIVRQVLAGKGSPKLIEQADKIVALAKGEGICSLITMPVAPLQSCIRLFPEEFTAHLEGRCSICAARDASIIKDATHRPAAVST